MTPNFRSLILLLTALPAVLAQLDKVFLPTDGGARCLDGSAPVYYWRKGSTSNYVIYFEGGAWCFNKKNCLARAKEYLGTSNGLQDTILGPEVLTPNAIINPNFHDWNFVFVHYCDGASYSGNMNTSVTVNGYELYFRGQQILQALIRDLQQNKDMKNAKNILVSGCSAGGLTVFLHCDTIAKQTNAYVRCVSDGGYFVDQLSIVGTYPLREEFRSVLALHNVSSVLNSKCLANVGSETWKCFMPQYFLPYIDTPIFVVNSGYDQWQMWASWFPGLPSWNNCTFNLTKCTAQQLAVIQQFHSDTMVALSYAISGTSGKQVGVYIDSCLVHCHSSWRTTKINGKNINTAIADWMFGRVPPQESKLVMCPYPCKDPLSNCDHK